MRRRSKATLLRKSAALLTKLLREPMCHATRPGHPLDRYCRLARLLDSYQRRAARV